MRFLIELFNPTKKCKRLGHNVKIYQGRYFPTLKVDGRNRPFPTRRNRRNSI